MGPRLALYSDQIIPSNAAVDRRLLQLIGAARPRIGYVASAPDPSRSYYAAKREYYEALGVELSTYVDEALVSDSRCVMDLFECDAIHLTGGNTYRFLRWLKVTGLLEQLRAYAATGGVLIGNSAGSLLMARDISIARLSPDEVPEEPQSLDALGLVDFHFWPHYEPGQECSATAATFLAAASEVLACPDGAGIIVDDGTPEIIGPVKRFRHGIVET